MFLAFPGYWSTPSHSRLACSNTRKQDLSLPRHDKNTFIYCACEMK